MASNDLHHHVFCVHCGHRHAGRPKHDICESCGKAYVVNLANPRATEVDRAINDRPPRRWGRTVATVVLLGTPLLLCFLALARY